MIMSPTALQAAGDNFGTNPVCVGPFKFATRVAQDRIEVVKDPNYYDAAKVHLDKVTYKIIADATTRFNNLRSGDVEVLDAVAATDVDALKAESKLQLLTSDSLGYQGITINLGNVNGVGKPAGTLPRRWPARWRPTPGAPGLRAEPRPGRDQQGRVPGPVHARPAGRSARPARSPPTPRRPARSTTRPRPRRCWPQAGRARRRSRSA